MKHDMYRVVFGLSVTLFLFSLIGIYYAGKGSGEYVVSLMSAVMNLLIIASVAIITFIKKRKNSI